MAYLVNFYQDGKSIDYTPASAVAGGELVSLGGLVGVAKSDIAASAKGALAIEGVFAVPKKNEAFSAGLPVWFDADGDPYGGTAGTGAATQIGANAMASGDLFLGYAVIAAAATDTHVYVMLNKEAAKSPAWANRYHKTVTTKTLDNTDGGCVLRVAASDQTLTLPEIATVYIGLEVIIITDSADGAGNTGLIIAPNANDGFNGFGYTHAVNKSLTNAKATSKKGDFIRLLAAGDTMWQVLEKKGTWNRAA